MFQSMVTSRRHGGQKASIHNIKENGKTIKRIYRVDNCLMYTDTKDNLFGVLQITNEKKFKDQDSTFIAMAQDEVIKYENRQSTVREIQFEKFARVTVDSMSDDSGRRINIEFGYVNNFWRSPELQFGRTREVRKRANYHFEDEQDTGRNTGEIEKGSRGNFSIQEPVETTADLVAIHNLTADKLEKVLELDGFPMPSIAITKADISHSNFGDISLVMSKDTVDPKASKNNVVYSADAWTPTVPRTEYEANEKVESNIYNKYSAISSKYGNDIARPLYNYATDLSGELTRYGGSAKIVENLS